MTKNNASARRNSTGSVPGTTHEAIEYSPPTTTTPVPTNAPNSSAAFFPSVIAIYFRNETVFLRPADLVNVTHPNQQPTVDTMSYDRFCALVEHYTGQTITGSATLMADVPDECGNPGGPMVGIDGGMIWRAVLQRCQNVGAKEVAFFVFEGDGVEARKKEEKRGGYDLCSVALHVLVLLLVLGALGVDYSGEQGGRKAFRNDI
ncbi:hypothetical protein N0V83_008849 [Neocucurbitaria cava]|uniref:Uncharacterized protein n=1 Tax=Neocucurbitaria cava TaxID=798079 RepID=A0A9W8Y1H3_9PLEO|nr:hypothetical protein N0V83_008849 [Neocucurbitaria cava]